MFHIIPSDRSHMEGSMLQKLFLNFRPNKEFNFWGLKRSTCASNFIVMTFSYLAQRLWRGGLKGKHYYTLNSGNLTTSLKIILAGHPSFLVTCPLFLGSGATYIKITTKCFMVKNKINKLHFFSNATFILWKKIHDLM